jgi:hypothetical protein
MSISYVTYVSYLGFLIILYNMFYLLYILEIQNKTNNGANVWLHGSVGMDCLGSLSHCLGKLVPCLFLKFRSLQMQSCWHRGGAAPFLARISGMDHELGNHTRNPLYCTTKRNYSCETEHLAHISSVHYFSIV